MDYVSFRGQQVVVILSHRTQLRKETTSNLSEQDPSQIRIVFGHDSVRPKTAHQLSKGKEIQRQEGVMKANSEIGKATYFGIEVEILVQLDHCSLVRNQDREFVVDTADLTQKLWLAKAA